MRVLPSQRIKARKPGDEVSRSAVDLGRPCAQVVGDLRFGAPCVRCTRRRRMLQGGVECEPGPGIQNGHSGQAVGGTCRPVDNEAGPAVDDPISNKAM